MHTQRGMYRFLFLLAAGIAAFAQPVSFGLKGGAPINSPNGQLSAFGTNSEGRWIGGPSVEFHLKRRFSIELDALYHTNQSNYSGTTQFGPDVNPFQFSGAQKTKAWDFPLLLKYKILDGPVKPFVSAGIQWSRESTQGYALYTCLGPERSCTPAGASNAFNPRGSAFEYSRFTGAPVLGAGFEHQTKYFTVSPEVRVNAFGRPNQNKHGVTAMVGFTFKPKK